MTFPRTPHVLVGAIAWLGSVLWLSGIAPLAGLIAASWGALTIVHTLAVAVTAVLAMLVAAAGVLLAADWRADVQNGQAWAQLSPVAVELSLPVSAVTPWEIDARYLPAADDEALRPTFRAYRSVPLASVLETTAEVPAAICATWIGGASPEPVPARTTWNAAPKIACDQGSSTAVVPEVDSAGQASGTAPRTMRAKAPIVVATHRGLPIAHHAGRAAVRTRLVVNARAWSGRLAPDMCVVTRTPLGRRTADIIVLSSSRDDQTRPLADASTRGNIASGTEPPSCRGPPQRGHRACGVRTAPSKLAAKRAAHVPGAGKWPAADLMVRDDFGQRVLVCPAELDVIETYLDHVLQELLASSTDNSGSAQS